jgi:hypothetical protein
MLPSAYLTDRQLEIWSLRLKGLSKAEIGRNLGITRQAVYDAEGIMLDKVERALIHTAESNMIEPRYIDAKKGVMLGYSPANKQQVIITFSAKNGIQTWHYEQPDCKQCKWMTRCRERLIEETNERNITLTADERTLPPSKLAHTIFSKVIPEIDK